MVGIIGGGLANSVSLDAVGLDAIPAPTGDFAGSSISETFFSNPLPRLAFEGGEMSNRGIAVDDLGRPMDIGAGAPVLSPAEANEKYGIAGLLNFTQPITEGSAQSLYDAKRAQAVRQDTFNRKSNNLLTGTLAQLTYGFIGGLADPLNLAAGLIPGVGEARVAALMGETALARVAGRVVAGATAGAAGSAALEPLNYVLDQSQGNDWTMGQALRNIAFGTAFGGGLHVGLGAIGDAAGLNATPVERLFAAREKMLAKRAAADGLDASPAPTNPISARIDALDPQAREQVLRGAVAQHVDGEPVHIADAVDASETARYLQAAQQDPRLSDWMQVRDDAQARLGDRQSALDTFSAARDARNRGEAPDLLAGYDTPAAVDAAIRGREQGAAVMRGRMALADYAIDQLRAGNDPGFSLRYDDPALNRPAGVDAPGAMPQTLMSRLRELGGLTDSGGELAARDLDKTPGMVRSGGLSLERAATQMAEEGYLPELSRDMAGAGPEQVDRIGALLDAIDDQRSGRPRLREQDQPEWDALMGQHEAALGNLREVADMLGISEREARGLSRGHVQDLLQRRVDALGEPGGMADLPGWEDFSPRNPEQLRQDMAASMDRMRVVADDPGIALDDRVGGEAIQRAPKVQAVEPDAQLAEAQAALDAVLARVQTEVAAGRLSKDALAGIDDAARAAEGDARAHEAAAACLATRMV